MHAAGTANMVKEPGCGQELLQWAEVNGVVQISRPADLSHVWREFNNSKINVHASQLSNHLLSKFASPSSKAQIGPRNAPNNVQQMLINGVHISLD